jgi:hypothetical protein
MKYIDLAVRALRVIGSILGARHGGGEPLFVASQIGAQGLNDDRTSVAAWREAAGRMTILSAGPIRQLKA